jgi:hypothetical protein
MGSPAASSEIRHDARAMLLAELVIMPACSAEDPEQAILPACLSISNLRAKPSTRANT